MPGQIGDIFSLLVSHTLLSDLHYKVYMYQGVYVSISQWVWFECRPMAFLLVYSAHVQWLMCSPKG